MYQLNSHAQTGISTRRGIGGYIEQEMVAGKCQAVRYVPKSKAKRDDGSLK
jgi:hypothetical protein